MNTGILLITHSTFGEVLIQNISHILGQRPHNLNSLDIFPEDNPEEISEIATSLINKMYEQNNCLQILIFTDLFGSTPSNIAQKLLEKYQDNSQIKIKAISGLNLPMLLRVIFYRDQHEQQNISLDEICQKAIEAIHDGTKIYN